MEGVYDFYQKFKHNDFVTYIQHNNFDNAISVGVRNHIDELNFQCTK